MKLYFGNTVTTLTTLMLLALLGFIGGTVVRHASISYWGRRTAVLLVFGLVACCFAAARDGLDKTISAPSTAAAHRAPFRSSACRLSSAALVRC